MADLRTLDALRAEPPGPLVALADRLGQAAFGVGPLGVAYGSPLAEAPAVASA